MGDAGPPGLVSDALDVGSGAFQTTPCWFDPVAVPARCGFVQVPESRGAPQGRTISLAVAVFSPPGPLPPNPDPIVYLEGGPGGRATESVLDLFFVFSELIVRSNRELVVIDQRGTGRSSPRLGCPEVSAASRMTTAERESPTATQNVLAAYSRCRQRLAATSSLAAFDTAENAADIEAVRLALGYPTWNLLGVSYGTRLGLEIMRSHPGGLRSAILDSVAPSGLNWPASVASAMHRTLAQLTAACDSDPSCSRAFPNLYARILTVAQSLETNPATLILSNGQPMVISGLRFLSLLRILTYDAGSLGIIPEFVQSVADGQYQLLQALGEAVLNLFDALEVGMYHSVVCRDVVTLPADPALAMTDAALDPLFRSAFNTEEIQAVCRIWDVPPAPPMLSAPVSSGLPTLLLSGHFDPATPPAFAEQAAATLSAATNWVLPSGSHGVFLSSCGLEAILSFLEDPARARTVPACFSGPPSVSFVIDPARLPAAARARAARFEVTERMREALERLPRTLGRLRSWVHSP